MIFNKSSVIIYIEPTILRYRIENSVKKNATTATSKGFIVFNYQNETDIDVFIDELRKKKFCAYNI